MTEVQKCRTCGAPVYFVKSETGRWMALDAKPERRIVVDVQGVGHSHPTFTDHHATCPHGPTGPTPPDVDADSVIAPGIPVRRDDGKVVGTVVGGAFHKRVKRSIHHLDQPSGWASDVHVLNRAAKAGATHVVIYDVESQVMYQASIERMLSHGVHVNRGHGEQVVLMDSLWSAFDPRQRVLFDE